jgi:NAD(P)-dependent dehydrogenase (short-subunit alcohol dehydrogenase family)
MESQAIVVTGASSGIGFATAKLLADKGFRVFAGVRDDAAAREIEAAHPKITAVRLDVTDGASIAAAATRVRDAGVVLRGLVNNAGTSVAGPLEMLPIDELRRQYEVNVFGQIAVTQAFLPMLRASRGRIVFVGSIAGRLAPPMVGAYSSSKFALRGLTDSLRIELIPAGIDVALIEPGAVKTPIWQKGRDAKEVMVARTAGHDAAAHYADAIEKIVAVTHDAERHGLDADVVAEAILDALTSPRARARYVLGTEARIQAIVAWLPPRLRDRLIRKKLRLDT